MASSTPSRASRPVASSPSTSITTDPDFFGIPPDSSADRDRLIAVEDVVRRVRQWFTLVFDTVRDHEFDVGAGPVDVRVLVEAEQAGRRFPDLERLENDGPIDFVRQQHHRERGLIVRASRIQRLQQGHTVRIVLVVTYEHTGRSRGKRIILVSAGCVVVRHEATASRGGSPNQCWDVKDASIVRTNQETGQLLCVHRTLAIPNG